MTKITVRREVLHQIARGAVGQRGELRHVSEGQAAVLFARKLADATAIRGAVVEIVVLE